MTEAQRNSPGKNGVRATQDPTPVRNTSTPTCGYTIVFYPLFPAHTGHNIDLPFTPTAPINFPLYLFVIAGLFGGMLLGDSFALIFELSDTSLRRRDQLEALTGVPVLSRIPFLPNPTV